jgi:hypothetical protein
MALRREAFARSFVPSNATRPSLTIPAAWHNANACTNRWPNADRCRLRNRAIDRKSGPAPAASHRNATTS